MGQTRSDSASDALLAAIVDSSDDAIVSKSLDGIVTSWNRGAVRLFGYSREEMIGSPIAVLAAPDRPHEMSEILERIRCGERIEHYETVRRRKDGSLVDISLSVSPVRDKAGQIVGASKIARDITERKLAEAQQRLPLDELNHRVMNTLATVQSLVIQTFRTTETREAFRDAFLGRVHALAATHNLLSQRGWVGAWLEDILLAELAPYREAAAGRINTAGERVLCPPKMALALGMAFHELASNAAKYGALSIPNGRIEVRWHAAGPDGARRFHLEWHETGGPPVVVPQRRGFGSVLIERILRHELGGLAKLEFEPSGLRCMMEIPLPATAL